MRLHADSCKIVMLYSLRRFLYKIVGESVPPILHSFWLLIKLGLADRALVLGTASLPSPEWLTLVPSSLVGSIRGG